MTQDDMIDVMCKHIVDVLVLLVLVQAGGSASAGRVAGRGGAGAAAPGAAAASAAAAAAAAADQQARFGYFRLLSVTVLKQSVVGWLARARVAHAWGGCRTRGSARAAAAADGPAGAPAMHCRAAGPRHALTRTRASSPDHPRRSRSARTSPRCRFSAATGTAGSGWRRNSTCATR
jgi:hypothetical protein